MMNPDRNANAGRLARRLAVAALSIAALAVIGRLDSLAAPSDIRRGQGDTARWRDEVISATPQFFVRDSFDMAIAAAESSKPESDIRAIVAPHHLLAAPMMADLIKRASGRPIGTVVIVGPNHDEVGPSVMTTAAAWETAFGPVQADRRLVDGLTSALLASPNTEGFREEHSIGAIIPFVRHYIPEAQVLPILLKYDTGDEIAALADWFVENLRSDALIVYSLDFSHYLSEDEAVAHDERTERLIRAGDTAGILKLNSQNVDSPAALALALNMARRQGYRLEIVAHANSNRYMDRPTAETTSYFGIVWRK